MAGGKMFRSSNRKSKKIMTVKMITQPKFKRSGAFNTPLPQSQKAVHRYSAYITLDPGVGGVLAKHVFSANGMFDPDITGVGHQPMGFDQLAFLYNHYTVVGSKITCTFFNYDAAQSQVGGVSVLDDTAGFTGDINQYIEQGKSRYVTMGPSGTDRSKRLVSTCSTKKFFHKSNVMDEDDLKGSSTANPAEQAYYHLVGAPLGFVDTAPVQVQVLIEYTAIWHEPRTLAQS